MPDSAHHGFHMACVAEGGGSLMSPSGKVRRPTKQKKQNMKPDANWVELGQEENGRRAAFQGTPMGVQLRLSYTLKQPENIPMAEAPEYRGVKPVGSPARPPKNGSGAKGNRKDLE